MQWNVYKGTGGKFGALQFGLAGPHYFKGKEKDYTGSKAFEGGKLQEGWKKREGCIFMDITSAKGKNVYDWEKKVIMALNLGDIGKILFFLTTGQSPRGESTLDLVHDPHAQSENQGTVKKFLRVSSPKGTKAGVIFSVNQQGGGEERKHSVPLTGDEVIVLRGLLQAAIPRALNW